MTSSHSVERPSANMVAAVSEAKDSPSSPLPPAPSPPRFLEPPAVLSAPRPSLPELYPYHGEMSSSRESVSESHVLAPSLHHIQLYSPSLRCQFPKENEREQPVALSHTYSYEDHQRKPSPMSRRSLNPSPRTQLQSSDEAKEVRDVFTTADSHASNGTLESKNSSSTLTDSQNHHMRSSPPIQPGEQNFPGKLPSFSEFLHTTRTTTPPRTPSRRNDSADSSPHAQPHFDDIAWSENKRRRVDTLGDIYARPTVEQPSIEPRRISHAIDPALTGYSPRIAHQHAVQPVESNHHHRPSHSYPPPLQQSLSLGPHARHQSSPVPQGSMSYAQQPVHQSVAQSPYSQSMAHHGGGMYESRHSYYPEPQLAVYGSYDRPQDSYYARPSYPGYESYGDIRFQQHVGLDHIAFNRKRRGNLPKEATNLLKDWFAANRQSPYPTEDQKMDLCTRTGLSLNQVSNWFINARRRAPQKEQRERDANGPDA